MNNTTDQPRVSPAAVLLDDLRGRVCPECGGRGTVCNPAEIGERLRAMRVKQKVTGREIARRMGFSAMYVCDLEHGRRGWNAQMIAKYVDALSPSNAAGQAAPVKKPQN